jgi:hypothetical protein
MRPNLRSSLPVLALVSAFILQPSALLEAATTINPVNKYAYGANLGWLNAYADGANGAVIGEYVCSGYIYAANVGWIHLGGGAPANQIQYQNNSGTDFGVNRDGLGNLRGYAYGANIGWLNFENTGAAKVDLATGVLSGYAYSANCGWISLSNAVAYVQTDSIAPGADSDGDGITDAWELTYTNTLTAFTAATDSDGDGVTDKKEYLADTNPLDANDLLLITSGAFAPGGTNVNLTWLSKPTRLYYLEKTPDLTAPAWLDSGLGLIAPDGATTTRAFNDTNAPIRFYRVEAMRPLP